MRRPLRIASAGRWTTCRLRRGGSFASETLASQQARSRTLRQRARHAAQVAQRGGVCAARVSCRKRPVCVKQLASPPKDDAQCVPRFDRVGAELHLQGRFAHVRGRARQLRPSSGRGCWRGTHRAGQAVLRLRAASHRVEDAAAKTQRAAALGGVRGAAFCRREALCVSCAQSRRTGRRAAAPQSAAVNSASAAELSLAARADLSAAEAWTEKSLLSEAACSIRAAACARAALCASAIGRCGIAAAAAQLSTLARRLLSAAPVL